jgi:hypothetical protein
LALEAKALTSKAVIAELEKINKISDEKGKDSSTSKMSKTLKSISPTNYLSRVLTNRNRRKTAKNMSDKQVLFIQNEFTPSNMTVSLTDEKIYKK